MLPDVLRTWLERMDRLDAVQWVIERFDEELQLAEDRVRRLERTGKRHLSCPPFVH